MRLSPNIHLSPIFLPVLSLLVVCPLIAGCLVAESKYVSVLEEKESCRKNLDQCRQGWDQLTKDRQALQSKVEKLEKENGKFLEDLANLGAEQEEMARTIANYKKEIEERETKITRVTDTYKNLMDHLSQEVQEGKIQIDQTEARLKLNLVDKILFPSGSATLTSKGKEILQKVGYALKDTKDRKIMIEGHTDDIKLSASLRKRYASNWDLSAIRAAAVVRYLQENVGVDPRLLSATGYSMYHPIVENDSPEHRQQNRRIEIVLVPLTHKEMQKIYTSEETHAPVESPNQGKP